MKEKIKKILNLRFEIPKLEKISSSITSLGTAEKVFFYVVTITFIISGLLLLKQANDNTMSEVPANGGYLKEGTVGSPRFVNPVLAISDVDKDLTALVYSGLMRQLTDSGLTTDLAQSYKISDDGLEYLFTLKDNIYFHDGTNITASDVEFTIKTIQNGSIRSPKRPNFYDIKVETLNERQIKFVLKKPYSPFLENLTVGIIPKHIWGNFDSDQFSLSQYNVEPVGSGPYKITKMETLKKNMLIVPTYYELSPFSNYASGKPFIDKITFNFYRDEETLINAYNKGDIEAINSISPENMKLVKKQSNSEIKTIPLPRVFAVFINQNESEVLSYREVRVAFDALVDRQKIVNEILGGYGNPLYSPIPQDLLDKSNNPVERNRDIKLASSTLSKAGWVKNPETGILEKKIDKKKTIQLSFSIATLNSPDLVKAAEIIKQNWEEIGGKVEIKQFELGDLQQNIIRPRKFDSLLYGEVIGRDMDFYAFWHSSQRNDPGLNVSMYTNSVADKLLDEARKITDLKLRIEKYKLFEKEINKDLPAIFLYSPDFIYIVPTKIKNNELNLITLPFERFLNISKWYIETNKVWKLFL